MAKGVPVEDILQSLPAEARGDFAKLIKDKGGVSVTLTVAKQGRKRKHRFANIQGKVIGIRFNDIAVYDKVVARAAGAGVPVSIYCRGIIERDVMRSHHSKDTSFKDMMGTLAQRFR